MNFFFKRIILPILFCSFFFNESHSEKSSESFESWLYSFKIVALNKGISKETIEVVFKNVKFLDQVIKYDRKQPEFFEDTITYVNKRANNSRKNKARKLLKYTTSTDLHTGIKKTFDYIKKRGPKKFNYHVDLEILNDLTPKVWVEKKI